ncbi:MAG TPA: aspartate--tRNA ligase [Acidimicrobiales bacterium]
MTATTGMRTHVCGELRAEHVDTRVALCGWVGRRREHGEHLSFLDLRDYSGIVQCVVDGSVDVRSEWVVRVEGTVRLRPEGTMNPELPTGEVELAECEVEILAQAEPPPFPVDDRAEVDESVRLRYRFVDLRRPRMQRNLRLRARVLGAMRAAMVRQGFCEVETPLLWTPTPEGAREFAVPSRLNHGKFYVLPQSPQIAKQLLMVAGMDRYFQIARCLRDEDLRADRQFEFSQLDIEASFVTERDVQEAITVAVVEATEAAVGEAPSAIETMTWHHAIDRFGVDKPDLRFAMELVDLGPVFAGTEVRAFAAPCVKAICVPDGAALGRNRLDGLVDRAKELGAKGLAWFKVTSVVPPALTSPLDKVLSDGERAGMVAATGAVPGDLVLVVADEWRLACEVLGQVRLDLGRPPVGQGERRFLWVTEFPLFDGTDDEGNPQAAHHPFTMPHPDDLDLLETDPTQVRSQAYDLVLNGWELGSGSIRIHREDIQRRVFAALGITPDEAEARFGFLLGAFRYGAPPHGGFAVGVDRFVAVLSGEENLREVIAYPKTQSGTDPMTGAPKALSDRALRDLGLRITPAGD